MKTHKTLLIVLGLSLCFNLKAQLSITPVDKAFADTLVNLHLMGGGVTATNVQFSGVTGQSGNYQLSYFTCTGTTETNLGMAQGIYLTTGNANSIPGDPNGAQCSKGYSSSTSGEIRDEPDAEILSNGVRSFNAAILEFDFVATSDSIRFNYVFGSEEYSDNTGWINYQCSSYNDQFGFLISGPGLSGVFANSAENIALLNNGSKVCINSVNNGVVGSSGGSPAASNCVSDNPDWVQGAVSVDYNGSIPGIRFNGNTNTLTAASRVTAGATYHIKILVSDISDGAYDSGVFLEEGSFIAIDPGCVDPEITNPGDIIRCDNYTLPSQGSIGGNNLVDPRYYNDNQANEGSEITNLTLTNSQTVWIYDENGICSDEESFLVTINNTPQIDLISDVDVCDSYTLPSITGSNLSGSQAYYTEASGAGTVLTGDITSSQTVYIYDANGSCTDETSFNINITLSPEIDLISDVNECDTYTLPAITGTNLSGNQAFYTEPEGAGSLLSGDLNSSQTVYIYDANGACTDETSFNLVITESPQIDPVSDVDVCDSYALPAITGVNLSGNQAYYTETAGTGTVLTGDISSSQLVYIYDANGSCTDETSFNINITLSPEIDLISDVNECDTYTLPAITGTNLSGNQAFYTEPEGAGSLLSGDLNSSQTVYIYDANGACTDEASFNLVITESPQIDPVSDVDVCDSYALPAITGANLSGNQAYYTETAGTGTVLTGDISSSQLVYIYDANGSCTDETSFNIIITQSPEIDLISDVNQCDTYTLPTISGVNLSGSQAFYTEPAGAGSVLAGDLSSSQTVYVYDANGNCTDETSFDLNITLTPQIDPISDVDACDSYALPTITGINLSGNQAFYTEAGASGTLLTGTLNQSQLIYIYDDNGTCTNETSFNLNITPSPEIDPISDLGVCDSYTLPSITGTNLSGNEAFYTEADGAGPVLYGDITSSQTIYIYDANGACTDESSFNVSITLTPEIDSIIDVDVCNQYILPAITGSNLSGSEMYYSSPGGIDAILLDTLSSSQTVYVFDANGSCIDEISFDITINPSLTPEIIGKMAFCEGSYTLLGLNSSYHAYEWSDNSTLNNLVVTSGGWYSVTVQDVEGCAGIDSVEITEYPNPTPNITGDLEYCEGNSTVLDAGAGYDMYQWSNSEILQSIHVESGQYYLTVLDNNGCSGIDSVLVVENTKPTPVITGNNQVCSYELSTLQVDGNYQTYSWSNSEQAFSIETDLAGTYYVTVSNEHSCIGIDSIEVTAHAEIEYQFSTTDASCPNSYDAEIIISTNHSTAYQYSWSSEQTEANLHNLSPGDYQLTVTDMNGCERMESFTIESLNMNCLNVPTAFSPNEDLVNDRWEIENIQLYDAVDIEIYNRWGQLVFKFSGSGLDYSYSENQWDGTHNGTALSMSSFVFVLDLNDGKAPLNGVVTIKK